MSVQLREVAVTADLTVLVTRDDHGTMADGARAAVAEVESVRDVDDLDVTGVRPRLNDLAVEVEAEITLALDPTVTDREAAAAEALAEGFGVTVEAVAVQAEA